MAKYLVETFYNCTFKVSHYLDDINEKELQKIEKRDDGKFEILDIKLDNRKTKNLDGNSNKKESDDEICGCINLDATNYNPNASVDDGSCEYVQYAIGDQISISHQNMEFDYCYPSDSTSTFSLSQHTGKVIVLDLAASW